MGESDRVLGLELGDLAASFNQMSADLAHATELRRQMTEDIAHDLRTLSLADAGELTLNRALVPPQTVLEQAAAAYRHQAEQQRLALVVDAAPGLPDMSVDPDRMAQVLGNLVSNALHHTPAGGQIRLVTAAKGSRVVLTVQDTGAGIAPEDLPRVFDRFYRGDQA